MENDNLCVLLVRIRNGSDTVSNSLAAHQKLNVGLPNDPVIALLDIYTQKNWKQVFKCLYTSIHSSITHDSQKEGNNLSVHEQMTG